MSDIYKNRQVMPAVKPKPKRRRRRSSQDAVFDESGNRRRRSRNSGFRRLLHQMRKPHNEKRIWLGMLIAAVVLLIAIGIWQFFYMEHIARERDKQKELHIPIQSQPQAESAAE